MACLTRAFGCACICTARAAAPLRAPRVVDVARDNAAEPTYERVQIPASQTAGFRIDFFANQPTSHLTGRELNLAQRFKSNCKYEVLPNVTRVFYDLDGPRAKVEPALPVGMTFAQFCQTVDEHFHILADTDDFVFTNACTPEKISFHLIFPRQFMLR